VQLPQAPYAALRLMLIAEAATAFDDLTRSGDLNKLKGQGDGDWPNEFRAARAIPAVEYLRASRIRTRLMRDMAAVMEPVDVVVSVGQNASLLCTNLTGHPTLVTQAGADENGRPNTVQLIGKLYGEAALLAVAELWQQKTEWHKARPKLTA
jgi:Asp-tRNA(Asn)/Glu-tRNA(Gln) amidotransferase A subunit family amidase